MSRHRFAFWGFKSPREWVGSALGALERQVMELAWSHAELSVREAYDRLGGADRLHDAHDHVRPAL